MRLAAALPSTHSRHLAFLLHPPSSLTCWSNVPILMCEFFVSFLCRNGLFMYCRMQMLFLCSAGCVVIAVSWLGWRAQGSTDTPTDINNGHYLFFLSNLKQSPMQKAAKLKWGFGWPCLCGRNLKQFVGKHFRWFSFKWSRETLNGRAENALQIHWNHSNYQPEKADWRSKNFRTGRNCAAQKSRHGTEFSVHFAHEIIYLQTALTALHN